MQNWSTPSDWLANTRTTEYASGRPAGYSTANIVFVLGRRGMPIPS
eukprot:IDg23759t1